MLRIATMYSHGRIPYFLLACEILHEYYFHDREYRITGTNNFDITSVTKRIEELSCRSQVSYFCQTWFDETDLRVVSVGRNTLLSLTHRRHPPLDKSIPSFVLLCRFFRSVRFFTSSFDVTTQNRLLFRRVEPQLYARHYVIVKL